MVSASARLLCVWITREFVALNMRVLRAHEVQTGTQLFFSMPLGADTKKRKSRFRQTANFVHRSFTPVVTFLGTYLNVFKGHWSYSQRTWKNNVANTIHASKPPPLPPAVTERPCRNPQSHSSPRTLSTVFCPRTVAPPPQSVGEIGNSRVTPSLPSRFSGEAAHAGIVAVVLRWDELCRAEPRYGVGCYCDQLTPQHFAKLGWFRRRIRLFRQPAAQQRLIIQEETQK